MKAELCQKMRRVRVFKLLKIRVSSSVKSYLDDYEPDKLLEASWRVFPSDNVSLFMAYLSIGNNVLIGDILVLLGASLYAVSNVCEEYIVKKLSRKEFLGMVGLFGTIISCIQLLIVEYKDIASIHWDWKIALLFVAFAFCMFCLYSFMPLVIKVTSATSVNLGILTADLYSLFFGLFLFGYTFSGLYILSFTVIMVGFILYCSTPTRTAEPAESSVPPVTSTGIDNLGLKLEENLQETHSAVL